MPTTPVAPIRRQTPGRKPSPERGSAAVLGFLAAAIGGVLLNLPKDQLGSHPLIGGSMVVAGLAFAVRAGRRTGG